MNWFGVLSVREAIVLVCCGLGGAIVGNVTSAQDGSSPFVDVADSVREPARSTSRTVTLPSGVHDIVMGGGGRYLIAYLRESRHIAVVDVPTRKLMKLIAIDSDDVRIAAGRKHLFVLCRDQERLHRFDLLSFEKTLSVLSPVAGQLNEIVMGCDSVDALGIVALDPSGASRFYLVEPNSLVVLAATNRSRLGGWSLRGRIADNVYASANGRVFVVQNGLFRWDGSQLRYDYHRESESRMRPNADGSFIYSRSGWFNQSLDVVHQQALLRHRIPSVESGYYLLLPASPSGSANAAVRSPSLHVDGSVRALVTLDSIDGVYSRSTRGSTYPLPVEKRFWHIPSEDTIVQVLGASDRLLFHHVDVENLLKKSMLDYLYVLPASKEPAIMGSRFEYQLQVRSKRGGVRYAIRSGPPNMQIDRGGKITWEVPDVIVKNVQYVELLMTDESKQRVSQTIAIQLIKTHR